MRFYFPIAKVEAEERMVWGYASTEAKDDQGETVRREALEAALGDYMRFANIREMHQLSAVGRAQEAGIDDKGLYVGARIVDPLAWEKVKEGVYNGFSIGGRVTARDPGDRRVVTGLKLDEISLVDRPANPEAVFDCWKLQGADMLDQPVQIWHCGHDGHRHRAKADAVRCLEAQPVEPDAARQVIAAVEGALARTEAVVAKAGDRGTAGHSGEAAYADPGYQPDHRKRYPIDTERHIRAAWLFIARPRNAQKYTAEQLTEIKARIVAAWREKIDQDGPPSADDEKAQRSGALGKALGDVGRLAQIVLDLEWLQQRLAVEAAMEGDGSPHPARLQAIVEELCGLLNALVAEETGEIVDEADTAGITARALVRAAGGLGEAVIGRAALRRLGSRRAGALIDALAKAARSRSERALLDLACRAIEEALGLRGLADDDLAHLEAARERLRAAGVMEAPDEGMLCPDAQRPVFEPPEPEFRPGDNATVDTGKVLATIAAAIGKRGGGYRALVAVAHQCLARLTGGAVCDGGGRCDTAADLQAAHDHLVAAGAQCADGDEATGGMVGGADRPAGPEQVEKAALIRTLADIVPRIDRLAKRVEDIATTPLPPLTLAKGVAPLSKQQDAGGIGPISTDELAAAFARMSPEEQTLILIKASHKNPLRMPG